MRDGSRVSLLIVSRTPETLFNVDSEAAATRRAAVAHDTPFSRLFFVEHHLPWFWSAPRPSIFAASASFVLTSLACTPPAPIPIYERPPICADETLINRVALSSPLAGRADIATVEYRADLNASVMEIALLDADGAELGLVTDAQLVEPPATPLPGARVGAHVQTLDALTLVTTSVDAGGGNFRLVSDFSEDGNLVARIESRFRDGTCADIERDGTQYCAPQLAEDTAFLLPNCGLDFDSRVGQGQRPLLTELHLSVPTSSVVAEADGALRADDQQLSTFTAVAAGETTDSNALSAFLSATSLDAFYARDDVLRLIAVSQDRSWMRTFLRHVDVCLEQSFGDRAQSDILAPGAASGAIDSGSNGNRSNSAFSSSSSSRSGSSRGDPHLVTFDGRRYDFQGAGDFLLAEREGPRPFSFHARFAPLGAEPGREACTQVTWATRGAFRIGDGPRIEAFVDDDSDFVVLVDGTSTSPSELPALTGATLRMTRGSLVIDVDDGTTLSIDRAGRTLALTIELPPANDDPHIYRGLLGNANGDSGDDLVGAEGVLESPVSADALRDELRPTWAVTIASSLFTYAADEGPDTFMDATRPADLVSIENVPLSARAQLEADCLQQGAKGAALPDCMLDLFCAPASSPGGDADTGVGDAPYVSVDLPQGLALEGAVVKRAYAENVDFGANDAGQCRATPLNAAVIYDDGEIVLTDDLEVTAVASAPFEESSTVVLVAGTTVRSTLVVLHGSTTDAPVVGAVTFAAPIVGLIGLAGVEASQSRFLPDGVSFSGAPATDFDSSDVVEVGASQHRLNLSLFGGDQAKAFRVLTEVTR